MSPNSSQPYATPVSTQAQSTNSRQKKRVHKSSKSKKKGHGSRRPLPRIRFESPSAPSRARDSEEEDEDEDEGNAAPSNKRQRQDEPGNSGEESRGSSSSSSDPDLEGRGDNGSLPFIDKKYWRSKGKILGRCVEMWDTFNGILDQGVSRNPDVDEDFMHTDFENQQYKKFHLLLKVTPAMAKLLERVGDNGGEEFTKRLHDVIDVGRKRARRADVNGIRHAIGQWPGIKWEPAFPVLRPLLRFNHPTTGELLCPASYNWGDLEVRDRLRRGIERVTASDLPTFLWAKGTFDLNEPFKGFLRGPLLVMAYKHIFISPSSAREADRSTRGRNAALHDVKSVTFESIAYVATVTRYALSDEATFNPGGSDASDTQQFGFPNRDFYHELLDHKMVMLSEKLLEWWNEKIFPCSVYGRGQVKENSVGAVMREQVRAKRLEAATQAAQLAAQATTSGAAET